jgi:hypothetical protein
MLRFFRAVHFANQFMLRLLNCFEISLDFNFLFPGALFHCPVKADDPLGFTDQACNLVEFRPAGISETKRTLPIPIRRMTELHQISLEFVGHVLKFLIESGVVQVRIANQTANSSVSIHIRD